jgi:hypothetical protein
MSIFSAIKNAIFGHKTAETEAPRSTQTGGTTHPTGTAPPKNPMPGFGQSATATQASTPGIPASPTQAKWEREVDVELVLESMASKNPQKLNWRTSIVDLMKLLGIDSSLENRKSLARELGYTGSTDDSATMNVWLHKRVMEELQRNGGKVPASLVA